MPYEKPFSALPDPKLEPEFYQDIALKRLIAFAIDAVIVLVIVVLALPFTAFLALFFWPVFYLTIDFFYRYGCISRRSATLGMMFTAIELRNQDAAKLSRHEALLHCASHCFSMLFFPIQIFSIILIGTTQRHQSLGDHLFGTAMINRAA